MTPHMRVLRSSQLGKRLFMSVSSPRTNGTVQGLHRSAGPSSNLDVLYQLAKEHGTSGAALAPEQVQSLCDVMDSIPLSDLGLDSSTLTQGGQALLAKAYQARTMSGQRLPVTYLDIVDDTDVTIGIFQLPPGAQMPLHDHPQMTVFSRLLYGTLHVRSYDFVIPRDTAGGRDDQGTVYPAQLVKDKELTAPAGTMVLFPSSGGNIHAFTAVSPCAILDVLVPPYGHKKCTYYREVFPPDWPGANSQAIPSLIPSDEVARQLHMQQQQQQLQQHQQQVPAGDGSMHPAEPALQHLQPNGQCQAVPAGDSSTEVQVGLQIVKEPPDFVVRRGNYLGVRVSGH